VDDVEQEINPAELGGEVEATSVGIECRRKRQQRKDVLAITNNRH
jgi:hypothetical protein